MANDVAKDSKGSELHGWCKSLVVLVELVESVVSGSFALPLVFVVLTQEGGTVGETPESYAPAYSFWRE